MTGLMTPEKKMIGCQICGKFFPIYKRTDNKGNWRAGARQWWPKNVYCPHCGKEQKV